MSEITVGLGARSYPIIIRSGILENIGAELKKRKIAKRYAVISDDRVAQLFGKTLMDSLDREGLDSELITFAHGEANKNLATVGALASALASKGFDRKDGIIGFGGGVAGDIAGFVASSYMRGVEFVQVPTTLLAQVDSSVGGKTGVDIPEGKNLVGAFYQPKGVFIDSLVLKTLPEQELLGGLAEVIKYGVIRDREFFDFLVHNRERILQLDPAVMEKTIATCCLIKADVVAEDEREGDVRRILNYGHTIGHAVEGASNYTIIHGLAVSIGMAAAARLACLKGVLPEGDRDRIVRALDDYGLPTSVPAELDRSLIKKYLLTDKKVVGGKVHYVLPTAIGDTVISADVTEQQIDIVLG
ncbi:3-dehydroquinate synthase [Desulforhopalus singaporensis]|uniref:3-dehydroquinate synthase n=1 Tax=Desulforhopalus singaporensis TaxID=91360 RepID=A0A1H0QP47_9BACT|nr:3-dehydroquinate synthase [Desulforhopalus singaporensis]SDP19114.1 3-dehydroquinate synthase [Desulforhopalus singaporensis]